MGDTSLVLQSPVTRIIHGPSVSAAKRITLARSASEGKLLHFPRLRFGLVWGHGLFGVRLSCPHRIRGRKGRPRGIRRQRRQEGGASAFGACGARAKRTTPEVATMRHTILDPIHGAIRLTAEERGLLATRAFRRLRRIRQLSLMHLIYPRAAHSRLEHSLGVMELATRIFDVVTDPANVVPEVRAALPELSDEESCRYWRRVVRVAALCHDLGHLPFSHAAEKALLPPGWTHEQLTRAVILDEEIGGAIDGMKLLRLDVAKVAVAPRGPRSALLGLGPRHVADHRGRRFRGRSHRLSAAGSPPRGSALPGLRSSPLDRCCGSCLRRPAWTTARAATGTPRMRTAGRAWGCSTSGWNRRRHWFAPGTSSSPGSSINRRFAAMTFTADFLRQWLPQEDTRLPSGNT